jgi:hypothetical protein
VRAFLDDRLGRERASLVRILGSHGVACKGGKEEATALLEALLKWKAEAQAEQAISEAEPPS